MVVGSIAILTARGYENPGISNADHSEAGFQYAETGR